MLPLKEKDKVIIQKLLASGCCARCVLRFCCIGVPDAYRQTRQETLRQLQAFISTPEDRKSSESTVEEGNNNSQNATVSEPESKRSKLEPEEPAPDSSVCMVCLGVLQHLSDVSQAVQIADTVKKQQYEVDTLVLSISLPAQMCVREHSCWLHVKEQVRAKCGVLGRDDVIQVKEALRWIMQGLLAHELAGVAVVAKSALEVSVGFTHPETDADCHFLASACPDCFKPTKNKQSVFTRMAVVKALEKIPDSKFMKHSPCPPSRPGTSCTPQDVQCVHMSVFVAGRYNKFCRSLPQTPWLIDGERRMESSVEELIATPVLAAFRAHGFNFSSSGREDVDVRTLGNGRPFALELLNPHKSKLSEENMKSVQQSINASSDKIRVRDLQMVSRDAMSRMKEGEEEKTKSYQALVWTHKSIHKDDIAFINHIKDLRVDQKTPLRVLHRRTLAVRQRLIHSMSANLLDQHHFQLSLKTQAGTYIKEFVHGDFGRTKPNLCQLLDTHTDILELDVQSVDVDWPPALSD
ncbi:putative tRNA pseudouridine synthase Pus10 isoform X1 [Phyllopteryx taeniolatus]|uniref:putative tRNA pseudouridine synthase Pus10 isoform X1 n=1 Tax=Phyllopteryx taeniolatus TaxID=161469 RepID=UPI002AD23DA1|nr:putative tRNA pseudouridine synthase Pus10 isoform X1 [Phyllopteryx taeniolatus]XP_061626148.1 putative tRNA pseudouridine synthase Pus10 isoform X1 [Phyllopteryx taeniolatus]